jgi:peroxiredoxin
MNIFIFKKLWITSLLIIWSIASSGQVNEDSNFFRVNFNAETHLEIHYLNFPETFVLNTQFFNFFPNDIIEGQPVKLSGNGMAFLDLKIQIPQKVGIKFIDSHSSSSLPDQKTDHQENDIYLTCFLVPFDTLAITINYSKRDSPYQSITYDGEYSEISKYYQEKSEYFSGKDFLSQKGIWANTIMDLSVFKNSIDSLTNIELGFLDSYNSNHSLPEWFIDYEKADLQYFAMAIKLDEPMLLRFLSGSDTQVPDDYFFFSDDLPLQNEKAVLSIYYFLSLRSYFMSIWEPEYIKNIPPGDTTINTIKLLVNFSKSKLTPYISDILLARELDLYIDANHITEENYAILSDAIHDESLKSYLSTHYTNRQILKEGDEAPGFYLKNIDNEYRSLSDFQDSLIYLCFWWTGCKPCIKEIPEENRLSEIFKTEKVKIISICMSGTEESWMNATEKYRLKTVNLFANKNWGKILMESYDIDGFPHYVIIDNRGKIIENKTVSPSNGAEQLIRKCLKE